MAFRESPFADHVFLLNANHHTRNGDGKTTITQVKAQKGIVHVTRKQRDEKMYKIRNTSDTARTMVIRVVAQ